jgi:hypothetical protein
MTGSPTAPRTERKRPLDQKPASRRSGHGVEGGTSEANRMAVAILEVLAGGCSPAEAAGALGISLPRYYILETRALEGLVAACEPKPLGKQPSPETRIAALEKALRQARRDCARQEALVRVTRRSVGLRIPEPAPGKQGVKRDGRGRKKRRPTVRALKVVEKLTGRLALEEACAVEPCALGEPGTAPAAGGAKDGPAAPSG